MKAIAYNIKPFEKKFLAIANNKKHEITLIANNLNPDTAVFAGGKTAAIITLDDKVTAGVVEKLAAAGIRYIVTRSSATDHIDKKTAALFGIKLANIPATSSQNIPGTEDELQETANQIIRCLDLWQLNKCVGRACVCAKGCGAVVGGEVKAAL